MVDSDLPPSFYDRRMKRCRICHETKPLDAFYPMKGMRDGHRNECKECNLARRKRWYADNSAKEIERVQAWRDANPERYAETQRRYKATIDYPAVIARRT